MADYNLSNSTNTNFTANVPNFVVQAMALDVSNSDGETYVYYDKAAENYGYYYNWPQIASRTNALCTWAFGQGYTTENRRTAIILQGITGNGKETFGTIIWNHGNVKLSHGDSFCEIVRNEQGELINLISISPERVKTVYKGSRIIRHEIYDGMNWVKKKTCEILHSFNKKMGDAVRGTGEIQTNKNINDAMIEAFKDERVIKHRDKALGIIKYKTNNTGKIAWLNDQVEKAVKNEEMLGVPADTADFEPWPVKSSEDRQNWLGYVEALGYQTSGTPRSMVTSDGTSEVGGINGHLIFETVYGKEQLDMENDLWNQVGIRIKFNRPPSLAPKTQENAEKNTGQTSIQPQEATPKLNR
jgi:hypothetical protein